MTKTYEKKGLNVMRILIDTNIIIDVLSNRSEFVNSSLQVWRYCEIHKNTGFISAMSIPNIAYILRKELTPDKTCRIINQICVIFDIVDLKKCDLKSAAQLYAKDFEDAIQICQAQRINAEYIITRNVNDFLLSQIPAIQPIDFLTKI